MHPLGRCQNPPVKAIDVVGNAISCHPALALMI